VQGRFREEKEIGMRKDHDFVDDSGWTWFDEVKRLACKFGRWYCSPDCVIPLSVLTATVYVVWAIIVYCR
jgi:hypothetical protein